MVGPVTRYIPVPTTPLQATARVVHGNAHHARGRPGLDLRRTPHADHITRQLSRAAHASVSTSSEDERTSRTPPCTALAHGTAARRAHPKCASSVEPMPPSATAEAVCITAALGMQWARAQRSCGTRAAASSCGSPPAASRGKPMPPGAHGIVQHAVDGLRATSSIGLRRPVAIW